MHLQLNDKNDIFIKIFHVILSLNIWENKLNVSAYIVYKDLFHMDSQSATPNSYTTPYMKTCFSGSLAFYAELWKNVQGENIFFIQC